MRWTVIGLLLINVMFLVWGWLGYSHSRSVVALGSDSVPAYEDMPGAKLVLLRENAAVSSTQKASPPVSQAPSAESPEGGRQTQLCTLLGPYLQPEAAKALMDRLAALQIQAKYVALQVEGEPDYWVYLRPEPTKEMAATKLRELQEKKIDSFIIPQGDLTNGISLGIFDQQDNAEKRQQEIVQMGYEAQLRANPRSYLENWVAIYPDQAATFSAELYNQLHTENANLDLRKDECRKVASIIDIH